MEPDFHYCTTAVLYGGSGTRLVFKIFKNIFYMTAFLQGVCVIFQQLVSVCISIIMIMAERLCGQFQWITYAPTQLLIRMHVDGCTMFQRIVTGQ